MKIEVFPDYCSTGLWCAETGTSLDPLDIGLALGDTTAMGLFSGLRQWHWTWEFVVEEGKLTQQGLDSWRDDGADLVAALNKHYSGTHTFIYRKDLLDA